MLSRILTRLAGAAAAVVGTFVFTSQAALACSCVGNVPIEESYGHADAVFIGTVVSADEGLWSMPHYGRRIEFNAEAAWKGVRSSTVTVTTGMGGGDCGYSFVEGERYVVFASSRGPYGDGNLQAGICSPTAPVVEAGETIAALGTSTKYVPPPMPVAERYLRSELAQPGAKEVVTLLGFAVALLAGAIALVRMQPRVRAGVLLIAAPVLANAAFTGLGMTFSYPQVLQFDPFDIFMRFQQRQGAVMTWFAVLAVGAGLMAPLSVALRRFGIRRQTMWVGIAAAFVQVVGLSRWLLLMPAIAMREDERAFILVHSVLGTAIGEGTGYLLTALWTALVIRDLGRAVFGRVLTWVGAAAAVMIASGVLIPFGLHQAVQVNFAGYVLWSVWLIALGVQVLRGKINTIKLDF